MGQRRVNATRSVPRSVHGSTSSGARPRAAAMHPALRTPGRAPRVFRCGLELGTVIRIVLEGVRRDPTLSAGITEQLFRQGAHERDEDAMRGVELVDDRG